MKTQASYLSKIKLIFSISSLIIFLLLAASIFSSNWITNLDKKINSKIPMLWNPLLNKIMIYITNIGSELSILMLSIILSVFFIYKREIKHFYLLSLSIFTALASELIIKSLLQRPRPVNSMVYETTFSFPSGHTVMASVLFLIILLYIKNNIKNKFLKYFLSSTSILIIILIGFSRIYLGAHWPTDVISGFLLGFFWLMFFLFFIHKK